MNLRLSLLLYAAATMLFTTWAYLPGQSTRSDSGTVTIISPLLRTTLDYASLAMAIALFVLGLTAYSKKVIRAPQVAMLLATIGFPIAAFIHIGRDFGAWTVHDSVTAPTGEIYTFLDSSFLQGQTMAFTKRTMNTPFFTQYAVLGTTNGDSPRSWLSIVRPSSAAHDEYGQLYLAPDEMIVGVRHTNQCYFAYCLKDNKFIGRDDVEELSPFLCLDADDELHEADVEAIKRSLSDPGPGIMGYPNRDSIEAGLEHPNAAVRNASQQILDAMDKSKAPSGAHLNIDP